MEIAEENKEENNRPKRKTPFYTALQKDTTNYRGSGRGNVTSYHYRDLHKYRNF